MVSGTLPVYKRVKRDELAKQSLEQTGQTWQVKE